MPQSYDNEKKFGLAFPLQIEEGGGPLGACSYEEHIKQSLRILLLTARGERVVRPGFGSGLHSYLFQGMNLTMISMIKYEITNTVDYFEPRIELIDVKVDSNSQDPGVLQIELSYRINSSGITDQLALSIK